MSSPSTPGLPAHAAQIAQRLADVPRKPGRKTSAAELVRITVNHRLHQLLELEAGTREGTDPENLHRARVAVRRLRATLRAAEVFGTDTALQGLRAELGWFGGTLGAVRDTDVLIEHFRVAIAELPPGKRGQAGRLITRLHRRRALARRRLLAALNSPRYHTLLDTLADAITSQDIQSQSPAKPPGVGWLCRPLRSARKAARGLSAVPECEPTDQQLHELRIKVKRLRYAAEMIRPTLRGTAGAKAARKLIAAATRLQDILGGHQDACVARQEIDALCDTATLDAQTAFALGMLAEREDRRRTAAREAWPAAWHRLDKRARTLRRP
ncbi:MAG: CHAD domain-containing protein [Sciscionella sp.]